AGRHAQNSSLLRFARAKLCLFFLEFVSAQRPSRLARGVAPGAGRGSGPPGPGLLCLGGVPTNRPGQRLFPEPLTSWGPSLGSRRLHAGEPAAPLAKLLGTLRRPILSGQREAAGTRGGHANARPSGRRTPPQGAAEPGSSLPAQCPAPGVVGVGDLYHQRPGDPLVSQGRSSGLWFALAYRNDLQDMEELFCLDRSVRGLPVPSRGFDLCQADLYHSVPSLLLAAVVGAPGRPGAARLELAQSSSGRGELPSGIGVEPHGRRSHAGLGATARYPLPLRTSAPTPLHAGSSRQGQRRAALEREMNANPQNYPDAYALKRGGTSRGGDVNCFSGFYTVLETAEAVRCSYRPSHTPLKRGVNERGYVRREGICATLGLMALLLFSAAAAASEPSERRQQMDVLVGVNYFPGWWKPLPNKWQDRRGEDWRLRFPERGPSLGGYNDQEIMNRGIK